MSTMKTLMKLTLLGAACGTLTMACSPTTPTRELVEARSAYNEAANSNASELVPQHLLSARQSLQQAENAHDENPGSYEERSLAYAAHRRALQAMALAGQAAAEQEKAKAEKDYSDLQAELLRDAQKKAADNAQDAANKAAALDRAQRDIASQDTQLASQAQALKEREAEIARKQAELEKKQSDLAAAQALADKERKAREEAEAKYKAALASLEEIGKVKEEQRGMVITLSGSVLFVTGKADLLPLAQQKLETVAEVLKNQDPSKKIVVEGHTDSVGSDAANMDLSQRRADSVRSFLVAKGVPSDRITAVGKGETTPVADNKTPEGRANNRRVEIVVK